MFLKTAIVSVAILIAHVSVVEPSVKEPPTAEPCVEPIKTDDLFNDLSRADYRDFKNTLQSQVVPKPLGGRCNSVWTFVCPTEINQTGTTYQVIQENKKFVQCYFYQRCIKKFQCCGFDHSCQQDYIYKQFWVKNPEGKIVSIFDEIPSSCCCLPTQKNIVIPEIETTTTVKAVGEAF